MNQIASPPLGVLTVLPRAGSTPPVSAISLLKPSLGLSQKLEPLLRSSRLALQLRSRVISEFLAHHDSWIMDGGWVGRGDAGAVGVVVAGREGADRAAVPASAHGAFCGVVPGCAPWAGAAQDGLDAGGGGGRSGPLAPAGAARPGSVGRRGAARSGARLCP